MSAGQAPFVGREAELAALSADLDAAAAGLGGMVLLAGEPGIGKPDCLKSWRLGRPRGVPLCWGPLPAEPEAARFRLFDSLAGFLRAAAARRPLLLVLDDLHWADAPSLALLRFAGRELEDAGLLVVGIYREGEAGGGHPLVATLADLTRG